MEKTKKTRIIAWVLIVCLLASSAATLILLYSQKKIRDSVLSIPDNVRTAELAEGREILEGTGFSVDYYSGVAAIKEYFGEKEMKAYPMEMAVAEYKKDNTADSLARFYAFASETDMLDFLETAEVSSSTTYLRNGNFLLFMSNYDAGCLLMRPIFEKDGAVYVSKPDGTAGLVAAKAVSGEWEIPKRVSGKKVTSVGSYAVKSGITSLIFSKFTDTLYVNSFVEAADLISFGVKRNNGKYSAENGLLYNKDKSALLACPPAYTGTAEINSAVKTVGSFAFRGCSSLSGVNLPDGLISVGAYAFYGCSSMEEIAFGASLTGVGAMALYGCTSLKKVSFCSDIPPEITAPSLLFSSKEGLKIEVPGDLTSVYKESSYFSSFADIIAGTEP